MTLATQQIEVLARFDGWEYNQIDERWVVKEGILEIKFTHNTLSVHLTSPGVLIEMRMKLVEAWKKLDFEKRSAMRVEFRTLDNYILTGKNTEAAALTSEIIQKLEA